MLYGKGKAGNLGQYFFLLPGNWRNTWIIEYMEYSYVEVQSVIHLTTDPGIQILHPNLLLQLTKNEINEHFVKRSVVYMFLIK